MAALTPEKVHAVVKRYIRLDDFTIIKAGDMTKATIVKDE